MLYAGCMLVKAAGRSTLRQLLSSGFGLSSDSHQSLPSSTVLCPPSPAISTSAGTHVQVYDQAKEGLAYPANTGSMTARATSRGWSNKGNYYAEACVRTGVKYPGLPGSGQPQPSDEASNRKPSNCSQASHMQACAVATRCSHSSPSRLTVWLERTSRTPIRGGACKQTYCNSVNWKSRDNDSAG